LNFAGSDMADSETTYQRLKRTVLEDPKAARTEFLKLFDESSPDVPYILSKAALPGESRLRQTIANAVRTHPEKGRVISDLRKWRSNEVDEFARRAIDAALADVDPRETHSERNLGPSVQISEIYRYVSERLRHKLRNAMLGVQNQAAEIRDALGRGDILLIPTHLAKLNDAVLTIGRSLEAQDVDPAYFEQKVVLLSAWLADMNRRYASQYEDIALIVTGDSDIQITGSEYLLETAFWNIWVNAQQAVGSGCKLNLEMRDRGQWVEVTVLDNGVGFPAEMREVAFSQAYSSKHPSRGRGLLEVQDAIERLGGTIALAEANENELRVRIKLPIRGRTR